MDSSEVQVWKIQTNELLSKHVERMAYIRATLEEIYEEVDQLAEETQTARHRLTMLINNHVVNSMQDFNETEHCAILDDNVLNVYLLNDIIDGVKVAIENDNLPTPIKSITVNDKQRNRLLLAVSDYGVSVDNFMTSKQDVNQFTYAYQQASDDVLEIIKNPDLFDELYPSIGEAEVYNEETHLLFIRIEDGIWGLEYVHRDDAEEFERQLKEENDLVYFD